MPRVREGTSFLRERLLALQIRYAIVMSMVSLLLGLTYREFARPFFEGLRLEEQLLYGHAMSLVHGHTFLLGTAIPGVLVIFTYVLAAMLDHALIKRLRQLFIAYLISASANVVLMAYQGLSFIAGAGRDLDAIDAGLFFGSVALRASLYAIVHITFAVTLAWYGLLLYKRVKPRAKPRAKRA
jgi:hypothetical protein